MSLDRTAGAVALTESQKRWLNVRRYLADHRYELAGDAARHYGDQYKVERSALLAPRHWIPDAPVPLGDLELRFSPDPAPVRVTGTEEEAQTVLPVRGDGSRYERYSEVLRDLAAPGRFENRSTYRLAVADFTAGVLTFTLGRYFDGVDVGEACAHEYAAAVLGELARPRLRSLVGDPCDPSRRGMNVAISTLTLRADRNTGEVTFVLHRRDAEKVGHAGGLVQVLPVGIFQAAGDEPWNRENDFSLWRCMVREYAEELLGEPERRGADLPIDYDAWPFAIRMTAGRRAGGLYVACLGMGVDPLTFATDLLTVAVFDAPLFDELFGGLVSDNDEGTVLARVPFHADVVDRFLVDEPMQAAGAATLGLAWRHRAALLA